METEAYPDKLTGYAFFEKIGRPQYIVAPMVDQSELAYRMLVRKYGAQLVYTQMYNSNSFVSSEEFRQDNFTTCPEDRPLIVQFAGHDPEVMLRAAKFVEDQCDAVDVNLGCPQGIAKRGRYGAYLMEELDLLHEIVSTLARGLKVPVTCKTRIYKDFDRSIRLCETLVNAGASMLVIHGRTREEKGQFVGQADWDMIRRIREHFAGRVPVIANGGIRCRDDIHRCMDITGCEGVMTSEGVLENPALFADSRCPLTDQLKSQIDLTEEYLHLCQKYPVWHIKTIRSHVMKFLHRYFHKHTDIRDRASVAQSIEEFLEICQTCREEVGDDHDSYSDHWYTRYSTPNVDSNPRLRHEFVKNARAATSLLDDLDGPASTDGATATASASDSNVNGGDAGEENGGGFFNALGMFSEDE